MNTLKISLLAATAAGSLLLGLSGLAGAQPPAHGGTDAIPGRPAVTVDGRYCDDGSGGRVWITNGSQEDGVYCAPNVAPAHETPAFSSIVPGDPDQGSQ